MFVWATGCSDGGGGQTQTPTISVAGRVNDQDIPGADVVLRKDGDDTVLASATCGASGTFTLSVGRTMISSDSLYVLTATHPDTGLTLRSLISGADMLAAGGTYASALTAVSPYTEAAYAVARTEDPETSPLSFMKRSIRVTRAGLPRSTGNDAVDALAAFIKEHFTDPDAEPGSAYTLALFARILSVHWPVVFTEGSTTTIPLPEELTEAGVAVSVTSFDGPDSVTVSGNTITVVSGAADVQGQAVIGLSLGGMSQDLTLPINTAGVLATYRHSFPAGSTASETLGDLTIRPGARSFDSASRMDITVLDHDGLAGTALSGITIAAAFDIRLTLEPSAPVTVIYHPAVALDPDKTVLIHINGATKVEQILFPDSYDPLTNRMTFTLDGFSPVLIGVLPDAPSYTTGSTITASDLLTDSARAFAFARQMADTLSDPGHLAALEHLAGDTDTCIAYLTVLAGKALASFMALPVTDRDGLAALDGHTFTQRWYSQTPVNAHDEYFRIRSRVMQALYRVANVPYERLTVARLTDYIARQGADIESAISAPILGQPDAEGAYYFPTIAYRVLKLGCTPPQTFFQNALDQVDPALMDEAAYHALYREMIDWIDVFLAYKRFTAPKVSTPGQNATRLASVRNTLIRDAGRFFTSTTGARYAGIWLGGVFSYGTDNDIGAASQILADINDTLDAVTVFAEDDSSVRARATGDTEYPLGSSVRGRAWVDHGSYFLPPEVNDEIENLENWRNYLSSLTPDIFTWYRDADGDGFGDEEQTTEAYSRPDGYVADSTDPDDTNATIYPDSREICGDGVDNDQNGLVDEGCSSHYKGTETTIPLIRKSNNQFLIPVDVGNQTLNLLVDTGSDALLVFADRLSVDTTVEVSATPFTKSYASTTRQGFLAQAAVRVGAYSDPDMTIMVVTSPTSSNDPSLTAKEADGIIGLRRTQGVSISSGTDYPDAPLKTLSPAVNRFELNLPPTGPASVSFGHMATLDRAKPQYVFKAKTYTFLDPERPAEASYADFQAPFRAKSRFGEANTGELDVLFDSGAVSKLVLDTEVAKALGYDSFTRTWNIGDDEDIEFNLVGAGSTITIYPKFKVSEISVAPLSRMGVTYEAVLGIDRWQHYVVGFSSLDYQSGGPDGTILMLFRPNLAEAYRQTRPGVPLNYQDLSGLNSIGDDQFPTADQTGDLVAFQSNRPGGMGGWDIYLWRKGEGLLTYPNLNSTGDDADPSLSGDGRYLAFYSNRSGDWDIYLYDIENRVFVDTPGLNALGLDRTPTMSTDGRFIAFRSERDGGEGGSDIYLYDRVTESLVPLPGLNTSDGEFDPVLNEDGTLIAFDRDTYVGGNYDSDVFLYNVATHTLDSLSDINGDSWDMDAVISPGGTYLTFHTNRHNPAMELYDRNFLIYNRETGRLELFSGLNSEFDEEGLCFTGNSRGILFHSSRPGGLGGSDIYAYTLSADAQHQETPAPEDLPEQSLPLTRDEASGTYTIAVTTDDGTELTLLLDTGVSGMILFADRAPTGNRCNGPTSVTLPYGTLNAAEQICTAITVGGETAQTTAPVIPRQSDYNALVGRSDLPVVDGVIGFRGNIQNEFNPKMLFIEFCFIDGEDLGLSLTPGLTIGRTPLTSLARGQGEYVFETYLDGVTDPIDPVGKSYTNMDVTFIARTDTGQTSGDGNLVMLSTTLNDTLILDYETARSLGYSEIIGWGQTSEVGLFFAGDVYILPVEMGAYPVDKILVTDLSEQHCQAVLSADRWMDSFVVGFASVDYQFGGPCGYPALLHVKDIPALQGDYLTKGRNYIALPGLNSSSDDDYPTVSIDGQTIAFQSTRNGDKDVFVYKIGQGLIDLPGLNSAFEDEHPSISGDGRLVVFHSNRSGNPDIYLYDIEAGDFIDLPDLNTEYEERQASISADGTMIAFKSRRPDSVGESWDIYLYSITDLAMAPITNNWVNTEADEEAPVLSHDASLLSFVAYDRPDSIGSSDMFVCDLSIGRLLELPEGVNEEYWNDGMIGVDGRFVLCTYYEDTTDYIKLMELSSGEFIYLPGLNTAYNDWGMQATPNAQYIVFESDRPGGEGGWDIYIYQRDETDTNSYTVTTGYDQSGYVTDADGNRMADEEIRAYDKTGRLIGTAVTDGDGNFTLTVPQGSQLGISFESLTADLSIVTDDVGDDTYVPDFEAGNLKFTEVWIEDTAQAGLSSTIHFDIEATVPKYNTYVSVYLKAGNPGDFVVDDIFVADYELTSLVIDRLGFRGTVDGPMVKQQKDTTTSVTYYPDTGNKKAYVEHTFLVPQGIADGVYTAVFAINTYDVTAEDDALQGESDGDLSDNFMVASASTIIGNPTLPNLRILSYELYTNSFELPASEPDPDVVPEQYDLSLNLEVESMAQDTTLPVDITFDLVIGGTSYPMTLAEPNEYNVLLKKDKETYAVTCRPEDRDGYPAGDRCASLYRQEQTGKTYSLHMNAEAYDALSGLSEDTLCYLTVKVDPDLTVEEYNDNLADNTITLPIMFLAPEPEAKSSKMTALPGSTKSNLFDLRGGNNYGNDDFGIGYEIGPKIDYMYVTFEGYESPYAVDFNGTGKVTATLFGLDITPLEAGPKFDFDFTETGLKNSYFDYGIWTFGLRVFGYRHTMPSEFRVMGYLTLWDSKDNSGNEKYCKRKEKKKHKTFMVGVIPLTVEGGVVGEIGIRGAITFQAGNKLNLEAGPYASLVGFLEASVGAPGFNVGVGIELTLIDIMLKLNPSMMVKPEVPIAIFELKAPVVLTTLNGHAYGFARALFWKYKHYLIAWNGYSWEVNLFPIWYRGFGATNLYNTSYYTQNNFTGTAVAGERTGFLSTDWGYGGPSELNGQVDYFSAIYEGYFEFSAADKFIWGEKSGQGGDYIFYVNSDDYLTIKMDDEDILTDNFGETQFTKSVTEGFHKLTVYYRELHSPAHLSLYWTSPDQFAAFYYNNTDMSGDPVLYQVTDKINWKLGDKSPKPGLVNADNFSIKYEGDFSFPISTNYAFTAKGDDVVRIYVDDVLVLNNNGVWYQPHAAAAYVTAGTHKVRVEYVEYWGGADLKVDWAPMNTFVGSYFNNRQFKYDPVRISDDGGYLKADPGLWEHYFQADFGWGRPANDPNVNYDYFSARWEGAFYFDGGTYDFVMAHNNELSVWVDEKLIGSYTEYNRSELVTTDIPQGWHIIRMAYTEENEFAAAVLKWGKRQKGIITEYAGKSVDSSGNLIVQLINRRTNMEQDWGSSGPQGDWSLGPGFQVIWEGDFDFDAAPYRFRSGGDNRVRVYLDNTFVVEGTWRDWNVYDYNAIAMNPGTHRVKVIHDDWGGIAWCKVSWDKLQPNIFYGKKFDHKHQDAQWSLVAPSTYYLDYDWEGSAPAGNVDNFMVVWTGVFDFLSDGTYRFVGFKDDDLHVWIDNVHVHHSGWGNYSFDVVLKKGPHSIKVRHSEGGGLAELDFSYYRYK
ncbi:hypothetical protein JCM14469_25110 [Desulfatiferula olefinivorans]